MTPPPTDPAAQAFDPLLRNRPTVGYVLGALAALFLAGGGYCFYKASAEPPKAEKVEKSPDDKPLLKEDADSDTKLERPHVTEFILGGIVGLICALAAGAGAGIVLGGVPLADAAGRRSDRLLVFAVGGVIGAALMLLGFALFYLWFSELSKWLGQADKAEPLKPLLAVLALLLGAGVLFAAVQPLRAEERNDVLLRRIVYGTNFFLTALLLVVALVFVNVLATLKLPSKLDTTETGFFTLSPTTKDYLGGLDKEIVIITTIPETREGADILRVLSAFAEANPKQVKVKALSLTLDKTEIASLKAKFPTADMLDATGRGNFGLIVAVGPDEKRYSFIQIEELLGRETAARGQPPGRKTLQCEPRLIREILFLTENKRKPVVYFTQGAGEVSVEPPAPGERNARTGEQLKQALIGDYCEVKPLRFPALAVDPKVPDDATVVIVADPTAKLSESTVAALGQYMATPRPDGSKGKLLVMAGARRDPGKPAILAIGIEKLLMEYDIDLRDRMLYAQPTQEYPPQRLVAVVAPAMLSSKNTIALTFADAGFVLSEVRPLAVGNRAARSPAKSLFIAGEDRVTWVEPSVAASPMDAYRTVIALDQAGRRDLIAAKEVSDKFRTVAAIASEPEPERPGSTEPPKTINRVVVFGYGGFEDSEQQGGRAFQAEVVSASVNWLRDRPAVANEGAKPYGVYTPNPKFDWTRGVTLPVLLVILGIAAVGLGLWVIRRR